MLIGEYWRLLVNIEKHAINANNDPSCDRCIADIGCFGIIVRCFFPIWLRF